MKKSILWVTALSLIQLFAVSESLFGGAPGMISYQGRLTNSSGDPENGAFEMSFAIYPDSTGGSPVWSETHDAVNVENGLFSVSLGSATSFTDEVFAVSDRWLEISVGGESISPRTRLVAVPYSYRVGTIEGAAAGSVSGVLEIGTVVKGSDLYESGLIIIGSTSDSVIISPGDDIVIRATTDDGCEAVNLKADITGGNCRISSSDAAKAGTRHVMINPADSIVIKAEDGDGDMAVDIGFSEYGGNMRISSSDAAKLDPDVVTSEVSISPMDNIALQASDIGGDTLVKISTAESSGRIELLSNSAKATRRVQIREDGIYFLDEAKADTNMIIFADGSIAGKGQLSMGQENADLGVWSNVLGYNNDASGDSSVVSGGYNNTASGYSSVVSGGYNNTASGHSSTVSGGHFNNATGESSAIGGGASNSTGSACFVGGGVLNYADGLNSVVGGGLHDSVLADRSAILGGSNNTCAASYSCVVGGYGNRIGEYDYPSYSFLGGGYGNLIEGSATSKVPIYATLVGGIWNSLGYSANASVLGGGESNYCNSGYSFVGGGKSDSCLGSRSVICGGLENFIEAGQSSGVIIGGSNNRIKKITGSYNSGANFIGNGQYNVTAARRSVILNGYENYNEGNNSIIFGGEYDTLGSNCSYTAALGYHVYLNSAYTVALYGNGSTGKLGINRDDNSGGISYPIHVGTGTNNGNGAYLSAGGTWTNGSSRTFKENFASLDGNDLLAKIADMQIDSWQYRDTDERHIGPVAEDFVAAFDVGATLEDGSRDNKYLSTADVAGVALAAVKELNERNQALEDEVAELRALVEKLTQER